ncbi:ABC-type sugar transport system permease subunit [Anaerotaenia torta]|uniref:carbohydrate ABC transporter permease n=1 Tax=Anaerotaenia torta TaxID=433293 RepID=UPI003D23BC06
MKKKTRSFASRQNRYGYLFMLPWIIGFAVFTVFPFLATIYLSFTDVRQTVRGFEIKWIALDNYITAFFKNTEFFPALVGYLLMIIPYTFVIVVLSFILAYLLNRITFLRGAMRTIYFLPVIIMSGPVLSQLLEASTAAQEYDNMLALGDIFIVQMIAAYSRPMARMLMDVFEQLSIILWFTGIPIILYVNGLQKINPSLYEAAQIDSANSWQILWKITIPIIKPIVLVVIIFTIANMGTFSINPLYELILKSMANTSGGLGFASTYAWIYSLLVLVLIGLVYLIFHNREQGRRRY